MSFATKLAHDILEMEQERDHLRHENAVLKARLERHDDALHEQFDHNRRMVGTILTGLLDPDSGINKTARIVERARAAGISEH